MGFFRYPLFSKLRAFFSHFFVHSIFDIRVLLCPRISNMAISSLNLIFWCSSIIEYSDFCRFLSPYLILGQIFINEYSDNIAKIDFSFLRTFSIFEIRTSIFEIMTLNIEYRNCHIPYSIFGGRAIPEYPI